MSYTLDNQYDLIKHWGIANNAIHLNARSQHIPINKHKGQGAFERYDFENASLSRVHCQFKQMQNFINKDCKTTYSIHFSLQGLTQVTLNNLLLHNSDETKTIICNAPSICLVKGDLGLYSTKIKAGEEIKAFYIEFDSGFISTLSKQLHNKHNFHKLVLAKLIETQGYFNLSLDLTPQTKTIIKRAWQLFTTPSPVDELSFMVLQGQTLSFASELLMQSFDNLVAIPSEDKPTYGNPNHAYQTKLLLDKYYYQNWSIRELANKSGTNECYLKQQFKQLTQLTIGEYRTQKRMQVAYQLLTQGNKVADVASQTGFNSSDYFVKVFKKFHGYHPAKIKHR